MKKDTYHREVSKFAKQIEKQMRSRQISINVIKRIRMSHCMDQLWSHLRYLERRCCGGLLDPVPDDRKSVMSAAVDVAVVALMLWRSTKK